MVIRLKRISRWLVSYIHAMYSSIFIAYTKMNSFVCQNNRQTCISIIYYFVQFMSVYISVCMFDNSLLLAACPALLDVVEFLSSGAYYCCILISEEFRTCIISLHVSFNFDISYYHLLFSLLCSLTVQYKSGLHLRVVKQVSYLYHWKVLNKGFQGCMPLMDITS